MGRGTGRPGGWTDGGRRGRAVIQDFALPRCQAYRAFVDPWVQAAGKQVSADCLDAAGAAGAVAATNGNWAEVLQCLAKFALASECIAAVPHPPPLASLQTLPPTRPPPHPSTSPTAALGKEVSDCHSAC